MGKGEIDTGESKPTQEERRPGTESIHGTAQVEIARTLGDMTKAPQQRQRFRGYA
jgi:hypothetical protein